MKRVAVVVMVAAVTGCSSPTASIVADPDAAPDVLAPPLAPEASVHDSWAAPPADAGPPLEVDAAPDVPAPPAPEAGGYPDAEAPEASPPDDAPAAETGPTVDPACTYEGGFSATYCAHTAASPRGYACAGTAWPYSGCLIYSSTAPLPAGKDFWFCCP